MTQPEALRLADALDRWHEGVFPEEAAAELRRLHAENALLHERHHFDNGVLKELLEALVSFTKSGYIKKQHPKRYAAAVAAIARAEGEPK
jgi:uncharacterized protein YutE (UPF0331/DUF86 family)